MTQAMAPVRTVEHAAPRSAPARTRQVGRRRSPGALPVRLVLGDLAVVVTGLLVVAAAGAAVDPVGAVVLAVTWPLLLAGTGAHRLRDIPGTGCLQAGRTLRAGAGLGLGCWVVDAFVASHAPSYLLLVLTATLTGLSTAACLVPAGVRQPATRLLVAGHEADVDDVLAELATLPRRRVEPVAVCSLGPGIRPVVAGLPACGGLPSVPGAVVAHRADAVLVLPSPDVSARDLQRLGWALEGTGVHLYVDTGLLDVAPRRAVLASVGGLRLLHLRARPERGTARVAKELLERSAAAVALVLLTPVLLAIAVAVRLDSPGPALFRQQRVGRHGRPFTMLKYRTMRTTAEEELGALTGRNEGAGLLFKLRTDPRITRLGGRLRRYSLDELPQLVNVVRGDMALVGPRPALLGEVARYDHDPRRRLAVKPGLTGLWQISGRSDLSWEQTVRLDLAYVDNWSLALDLRILLRTVGAVLSHRGAY